MDVSFEANDAAHPARVEFDHLLTCIFLLLTLWSFLWVLSFATLY